MSKEYDAPMKQKVRYTKDGTPICFPYGDEKLETDPREGPADKLRKAQLEARKRRLETLHVKHEVFPMPESFPKK